DGDAGTTDATGDEDRVRHGRPPWPSRLHPLARVLPLPNSSSRAVPPARAVKAALAEALVWYYPVAGRLREIAGGKLVVDCTAEGVAFVEADADVRLEELGEPLLPPFPCVEVLLCDAGDIGVVVGKPIVFLQV
ncbi:Os10g0105933, partial [Oryza sativa Japonica Group]